MYVLQLFTAQAGQSSPASAAGGFDILAAGFLVAGVATLLLLWRLLRDNREL